MTRFLTRSLVALTVNCLMVSGAEMRRDEGQLIGFASLAAYGVATTTGGGKAPVITVRTAKELQTALERLDLAKHERETTPRVVRIDGDIDLGELANERPGNQLKAVGRVRVGSHTTVYALGKGATIRHGTLEVHGANNVILRNLKFRDLWEEDLTGEYDRFGWDYVRIANSGKQRSHHVWIDHCDFEKVYDGMVDITLGSDLVTVSWCRFAGDVRGPQKKVSLIGHSSSDTAAAVDRGRLNVTLHHNLFENIGDRAPRARFGNIHALNNCIVGAENATISVMGAVTLVDHCHYQDARIATSFSHASDAESKGRGGKICIVDSRNVVPRPPFPAKDEDARLEIEQNFKSNVPRDSLEFNAPAEWSWGNRTSLPYAYQPDPPDEVPAIVKRGAGVGKLPDSVITLATP